MVFLLNASFRHLFLYAPSSHSGIKGRALICSWQADHVHPIAQRGCQMKTDHTLWYAIALTGGTGPSQQWHDPDVNRSDLPVGPIREPPSSYHFGISLLTDDITVLNCDVIKHKDDDTSHYYRILPLPSIWVLTSDSSRALWVIGFRTGSDLTEQHPALWHQSPLFRGKSIPLCMSVYIMGHLFGTIER